VAEIDCVAAVQLCVDRAGRWPGDRCGHLVEQRPLSWCQVWLCLGPLPAHDCRIVAMRQDLDIAPVSYRGRRAGVVFVAVGDDHAPKVTAPVPELRDGLRSAVQVSV
jgi:hypothetical protein